MSEGSLTDAQVVRLLARMVFDPGAVHNDRTLDPERLELRGIAISKALAASPGGGQEPEPYSYTVEWMRVGADNWHRTGNRQNESNARNFASDLARRGYRTRVVPLYRGTPIVYEPASTGEEDQP